MGRLGDLLRTERLRRNMTYKQAARLGGVSEGYLKEVEAGTRIIADDQARRILKKMGLTEQNEEGFSLDDITATVDLETVMPAAAKTASLRRDGDEPAYAVPAEENAPRSAGGVWLDALTSVLKRVPVYNLVFKEVDHRLLPILSGRVEGASPDKVFYLSAPDDSMRGFRILHEDLCLIVPASSPVDDAIMLVECGKRRFLRKVKRLDETRLLLLSYDRELAAEAYALPDVTFMGRVVKVEFSA